jgi:hypothetical protein
LNIEEAAMNSSSKFRSSEVIREARQRKYKTAKEFWAEHEDALKVSYPHYASIETGSKLSDIALAISISKILKIDLRLICHLWAKDNMPDAETKAFFEPVPGRESLGLPSALTAQLDEFFVFTEGHIPFFEKHPAAWDVLSFIMCFGPVTPPTEKQISESLGIDLKEVQAITEWLRNESLVVAEGGKLRTRRKYFHLPNTDAFKAIRDRNFSRVSQDLLQKIVPEDLKSKEAYRTTYIRRVTKVQAQEISRHIDDLIGHFGNMPDMGQEYYALTIALGSRAKFAPRKDK